MTITMVRMEFGLDVYIDHGEFQGFKAAPLAEEQGVPAILGPRAIEIPSSRYRVQPRSVVYLIAPLITPSRP